MSPFDHTFQEQVAQHREGLTAFLNSLAQRPAQLLDAQAGELEAAVWEQTDCLACARCCRRMSPAFTVADIKRIATHFRITVKAVKEKWLYQNKEGVFLNRTQPCQFLDTHTNACTIYAIRPADCAQFPHLSKTPFTDYLDMHRQNLTYCPATFSLVQKLQQRADDMGI